MDKNCIFCKIIAGSLPSHKVYEDDQFLAFLDIHPLAPGHTQVIPKNHHRYVWDVPNVGEYFEITRKIAQAIKKGMGADIIRSQIYGEEVPHAHIWLWADIPGDIMAFEENKNKIINALK